MRHKTVIAQTVSESQIVTQKNNRVNSIADDLLSQSRLSFGLKQTILPKRTILKKCFFDSKQTILVKADDPFSLIFYISKQTILVRIKRVKADDPGKSFFDSKQTILVKADDPISFIFYISKQTISVRN